MKTIKCNDIFFAWRIKHQDEEEGPGNLACPYVAKAETDEEAIDDLMAHAREAHPETVDNMLDEIEDEMEEETEDEDGAEEPVEEFTADDRLRETMRSKIKEE